MERINKKLQTYKSKMKHDFKELQKQRREYQDKVDCINLELNELGERQELSQEWHDGFTAAKRRLSNRVNRGAINFVVRGGIKDFNNAHPEYKISGHIFNSLAKRVSGALYGNLVNNIKLKYLINNELENEKEK